MLFSFHFIIFISAPRRYVDDAYEPPTSGVARSSIQMYADNRALTLQWRRRRIAGVCTLWASPT